MGEIGIFVCIVIYAFWATKSLNRVIELTGFSFFTNNIVGYVGIAMMLGIFLIPLCLVVDILLFIFRLFFGRK